MSNNFYTSHTITSMNYSDVWRNCITIEKNDKNDTSGLFELHATGYADLDGRKYVALPKGTNVKDPDIKKKYNLL